MRFLRNILALTICLCFLPESSASMKKTVKAIVTTDTWALAKGTHDGKPLLIRYRSEFEGRPDVRSFPKRIKIMWKYEIEDSSGMPNISTDKEMERFENRLVPAVEHDLTAVLVAVITNNGERTWVYYASGTSSFSERLHEMPQEKDAYPIHIEAETDPAWSFLYQDILEGLTHGNP